jgi:type VI secretion system protein ImpG
MANDAPGDLLRHYREELSYLRRMGAAFARRFPAVAARLELGPDVVPDPHVERLVESFAFLTARIQRDLDGSLPEITTGLLDVLYPHFVAPMPSMSIARIELNPKAGKLTSGYLVPKHTPVFATRGAERAVQFRTGYPVTLWPIEVASAALESPDRFGFLDFASDVASVLRISLRCTAGEFRDLHLHDLRFHIGGDTHVSSTLYETIFTNVRRVAVVSNETVPPQMLPRTAILPVGFGAHEELLPQGPHGQSGYGLLQEYFAFPAKFNFFDLAAIDASRAGATLELLFLLDRPVAGRMPVDATTFALGCTPIVNLFSRAAEPIRFDQARSEYRVVPDQRREASTEVHSILRVASQREGDPNAIAFQPFFSFQHAGGDTPPRAFWYMRRQPFARADVRGSDALLSLVDLDFRPTDPRVPSVYVQVLCTNRHLAEEVSTGAALQTELAGPLGPIEVLYRPTPQRDAPLGGASHWKLISHLTLNHLSLDGLDGARALREMLRLYAGEDPMALRKIAGLRDLASRRVTRRLGADAWRGYCRGTEITMTIDETDFVGGTPFLFAAVMNRFFAQHAAVNSFTQLRVITAQREGVWLEWPPTAGTQIVA